MKGAAIFVVALLAANATVDGRVSRRDPAHPGEAGKPSTLKWPRRSSAGPKCGLACDVCDEKSKKCLQCKSPEHVLKPGNSGQCMCAVGYGSYYYQTPDNLQPSKAPICDDIEAATTGALPAQGPCICFKCQTGYSTRVPQRISSAICMPIAVNCVGSWTEGKCTYADPCSAGNRTDVYKVTTPAKFGGAQCPTQDGETRTVACNSTLADNSSCGARMKCWNGTCAAVVDCVGDWAEGQCMHSDPCSAGSRTDIFKVTTPAKFGGAECPAKHGDAHAVICNSTLADGSNCGTNMKCWAGTCTPVADCMGDWAAGQCTYVDPCASGSRTDTYQVATPARFGGKECPAQDREVRTAACNSTLADSSSCGPNKKCWAGTCTAVVDCVGSWTEGQCTFKDPCSPGKRTDTYKVTTIAKFGGAQCPAKDGDVHTIDCNSTLADGGSCGINMKCSSGTCTAVVDCVGSWMEGQCSFVDPCSAGNRTDTYKVTTPAVLGGAQCPATHGDKRSVVCNSTLADNSTCDDTGKRCWDGTCTMPVDCNVTYAPLYPCTVEGQCSPAEGKIGQFVINVSGGNPLGYCPEIETEVISKCWGSAKGEGCQMEDGNLGLCDASGACKPAQGPVIKPFAAQRPK